MPRSCVSIDSNGEWRRVNNRVWPWGFILKRTVEPSTLFGFWFQGFMVSRFLVSGFWFHGFWFLVSRFQGFMVSSKSGSGSLSGSKSTVAPTQWLAAASVMVAAIPIPIPIAISMVAQWNLETHDLRTPLSLTDCVRKTNFRLTVAGGFDKLRPRYGTTTKKACEAPASYRSQKANQRAFARRDEEVAFYPKVRWPSG